MSLVFETKSTKECNVCQQKLCPTCDAAGCDICLRVACGMHLRHYGCGVRKCDTCRLVKIKALETQQPCDGKPPERHVHYECIDKLVQRKLHLFVLDQAHWQSRAEDLFKKYGPGVLIFDASEKRKDDQVNLYYGYDKTYTDSFPVGFDANQTWAISYVLLDDFFGVPVKQAARRYIPKKLDSDEFP